MANIVDDGVVVVVDSAKISQVTVSFSRKKIDKILFSCKVL